MTGLRNSFTVLIAVGWVLAGLDSATAENWPGWRKDGSGVVAATATGVPIEWSTTKNVRWSTPIPGQGHSSPIVWGDQVFVTSVTPKVDRNPWLPILYVVLTLLCGLALWRLTDGTFGDPLGNRAHRWTAAESKSMTMARRISVWLLFVILGYGTIIGVELAYDHLEIYPESLRNRLIDRTWYFTDAPGYDELDTPISPFRFITGQRVEGPYFGAPRIPLACYYGGAIAMLSLLGVNSTIARRRKPSDSVAAAVHDQPPAKRLLRFRLNLLGLDFRFGLRAEKPLGQILQRAVEWLGCIAAACALITVHSAAMADLPFVPSATTWFLSAAIGVVALIAFNLLLPGRPSIRVSGMLITGVILFFWVTQAPPNVEFGLFATAQRAGLRPLVKALLALGALGLLAAWVAPTRTANDDEPVNAKRPRAGAMVAVGLLACGLIYFVSANYLLPRSIFAREIVSLDRRTGDVIWTARCDASETISDRHAANSLATPTPVTDGEHVYAHFGDAGIYCVDMQGELVWECEEPVPPSHWGAASSLVLWGDLLIMTCDSDLRSITVGIDKGEGVERWRAERTNRIEPSQLYDAYATPIIVRRDGHDELVHLACKLLVGYDPATGEELWVLDHPGEQPVATPVIADDLIIILGGKYAPYMAAVRVNSEDGQAPAEVVWEATRNLSDMPSPVVYDGYLYMVTKDGIASCIDARTGQYQWRRRIRGAYWASVTAADGKIFFCDARGTTTVVAAGSEYQELSRNELDDDVYASFAFANGEIFIRTANRLVCIGSQ